LQRSLRHADVSVVVDLSHTPHDETMAFVRSVLPAMSTLRRHTGLPHRIVVDEAHYFLHDPDARSLLDFDHDGYTFVTYEASKLHPEVLSATEVIVVTRESDPAEVRALRALCNGCQGGMSENEWQGQFERLAISEAFALPVTAEAEGGVRKVHLAPRLTPHARHASKYLDIPVTERSAFVFWRDGAPNGRVARTLREFVAAVEKRTAADLKGHLLRGDFSKWIANVFGDFPLAKTLRQLEEDYRSGQNADPVPNLVQAIRSRYEFIDSPSSR
jgi:hypothetical protein